MSSMLKHWWVMPVLRGVLALIFALILFCYPVHSLLFFISFIGAFIFIFGLSTFIMAFIRRPYDLFWRSYASDGVLGVVMGLLILLWPALTGLILIYLIAIWALISGLLQIMHAWRLRQHIGNIGLSFSMGILFILLAIIAFIHPNLGLATISYAIGFFALIYGIMSLIFGLWIKQKRF